MTRGRPMEMVREMIQAFEQAAWTIAEVELDEESWTTLRGRVVELVERGDRALGGLGGTGGETWTAIRWDRPDSPVVLCAEVPMPAAGGHGFAA